jgi:hypothetical protein
MSCWAKTAHKEIKMETVTIYRDQFDTRAKFLEAVREAKKKYVAHVIVDDGNGGNGHKFFESVEDYRIWKNQK